MGKSEIRQMFQKDPDTYWKVRLFDEQGWVRKRCKCGKYFWTLDPDRELCGEPHSGYTFIGKPRKRMDYIETWKAIEDFFKKKGHTSIPRYPVICRWFPGLYFTIASIVAFQREVGGKTVFEMPANPLIIPQVCLRFNDIPNIGVSGRHMSSFVMVGQHSLFGTEEGGYWKDRTIELDFELLTRVFGIKPEDIIWNEDVWVGPAAFGSSLEYFVDGLELGNAVFTQFRGTLENFEEMHPKVIDMGAGLERFVWLSNASPTIYDPAFGPVIPTMQKIAGIGYDEGLFTKYARLAAFIDADEIRLDKALDKISSKIGIGKDELEDSIAPMQAIYAVADHARTISFAIADGGLPSNVGGGYNLRVIARRAFELINKYGLNLELGDVSEMHAKYLKPMFPELLENVSEIWEILDVEKRKYERTLSRARRIVSRILSSGEELGTERLIELYDSHGITPELIQEMAFSYSKKVDVPQDFYSRLTERHSKQGAKEKEEIDVSGIPPTELLFRKDWKMVSFRGKVMGVREYANTKWYAFDRTVFYPASGGQDCDYGKVNGKDVLAVQKVGDVVLHKIDADFSIGDYVEGTIDWERRLKLTRHHTATHIINGACRNLLGKHIWQAGAEKKVNKARLDITHYALLTPEQLGLVEDMANKVVLNDRPVNKFEMPRVEAEQRFGFRIYQGGVVPSAVLRIVDIDGWDVEACGGTHVDRTSEVGPIMILGQEKIQDGVVRINFVAGDVALARLEEELENLDRLKDLLGVKRDEDVPRAVEDLFEEWKITRKRLEEYRSMKAEDELSSLRLSESNKIPGTKFLVAKIDGDIAELREISKRLSAPDVFLFLVGVNGKGRKAYVFSYAGEKTGLNAGRLVREFCQRFGGGGGGPPSKGEGAFPLFEEASIEEALNEIRSLVK